jgi:hypothetical protein
VWLGRIDSLACYLRALAKYTTFISRAEAIPSICEWRSIVPRVDEVFIAEDDGDDFVSVVIQPLLHSNQIIFQCACVQLVTASVTEVDVVLIVVCFALN